MTTTACGIGGVWRAAGLLLAVIALGLSNAYSADRARPDTTEAAFSETLDVTGGRVRLIIADEDLVPATDRVRAWTKRSADIVSGYYGSFPMLATDVVVDSQRGSGIGHGVSFREGEGLISISVGTRVTEEQLRKDWVLVHEMIHLALPNVWRRHAWLAEGLSTYVEGIARVQAGNRTEADVWLEFMRAMPQGLPREGDEGLDRTHTWGRTYWGGALFCLTADMDIRERTNGRKGLQDALAAVALKTRGDSSLWSAEAVFRVADEAIGVPALTELYAKWKDTPVSPDLNALWASLGVARDSAGIRYDNNAPRAALRRAIMAPR